ncbi:N-acetylglucosamine kinase [Leifsonia sp. NPDC056824]|uniref:N-acetylglucosamine kinase n=1 Tax=Leifsonia sp. NPDC056824 TaxID=3345953 RepID=UPI0036CA7B98
MAVRAESGPLYLAVDAGNSKTVALVVDGSGIVLGRGRGGRGDIYGAERIEVAEEAVFGAVESALGEAGATVTDIRSAAFRLAGVDYPEDASFWDERIADRLAGMGGWSVKNDGFASLRLIDGTGVGLSITVGTGPAVAARSADGREQCSGWYVFDDLGGQGLGNSALKAACREWMGLGPATRLTEALCTQYDVADPGELRHVFTRRFGALPGTELWKSSRIVLALAGEDDAVAQRIVDDQAEAFVRYAQWCAGRVGADLAAGELPVLLNGSVATSEHPAMRDAITAELARIAPAARVTVASDSPLHGVVLDALAEGGVAVTPELIARLRQEHPEAFLAT